MMSSGASPASPARACAWVSGQLPWRGDGSLPQGKLGGGLSVAEGKEAARLCILNGLAVLREAIGSLDRVARVVKLVGFVASAAQAADYV